MMKGRGDAGLGGGGGDGGVAVRPQPWRVPWRRSVGFWLGSWVLAFLVWVWVDSFRSDSEVSSRGFVRSGGSMVSETGWRVMLDRGRLSYTEVKVHEAPPGAVTFKSPVRLERRKSGGPFRASRWGMESSVNELRVSPDRLSLKTTNYWFPFAVVVAGYVVLWLGSLALWRRWMMRRWRAAQGDGEWMEGEVVVAGEQSNRM